jgi:hypothetical protein
MRRFLPLAALAMAAACHDSTGPDAKIATLVVTPSPMYLALGDTARFFAHGTGAVAGTYVSVSPRYTSLDPAVATVTADGLARGVAVGTARIVATAGGHADTAAVNVLALPAVRTFNVSTEGDQCARTEYHGARVAATSAHAVIYEDVANPPGGFTPAEYAEIADEFERIVWPTDTHAFGTPTDLDGNGHVDVLYTRAVNELTPAHVGYLVGGFFDPRDVFPRAGGAGLDPCPASNQAEMFYILVPDSAGAINGNVRTKDFVRQTTVGTLAHELQHLINTSRRVYVNHADSAEVVWLDEGLSHVAEELAFRAASGIGPRQNLGQARLFGTAASAAAYETFGRANLARLGTYLQATEANSPWARNDQLETRGATWSLLRYLADRRGGDETAFWYALVNAKTFGLTNLETALGADPVLWARDWSVANYADDVVPVAAEFTHPSWNFRDMFVNSSFGGYPLRPIPLGSRAGTVTIKSGSAAFLRFGVAANGQGEVRFTQGTATVAGECSPVSVSAAEVQTFTVSGGLALCFPGGAGASAEYTVVAFHGSEVSDALYSLHVVPQNLILASTLTDRLPTPAPSVRADAAPFAKPYDGGWEMAFRERAWRSLAPRVQRFRERPRFATAAANGPSTLYLSVLRTK